MDQQKWGQPGLATLTLISVHMAAIIVASACVLQKCLYKMAYEVWSFRVSLFWLCCGCEEGTKYANGHYYPGNTTYIASSSVYCGTGGTADISTITVASNICRVLVKRKLLGQAQEL